MTTATDPDVEIRNADTGQVYPSQVLNEVARLDGAATDTDLHAVLQYNHALRAELERTRAELAALQVTVSPLDAGWTPPSEKPTAWIEEQTIAHRAAEHRPTADTHNYIADLHKQDRERWDSVHDDIEALSAHEPADVWDDALRALLAEPVQVDYSYRQSEAWLWAEMVRGQSRQRDSVYDQLAPERIQAGPDEPPPEHDRQGNDPDLTPEHERRPEQSTADADRRAKVLAQAAHGERAEVAADETVQRVRGGLKHLGAPTANSGDDAVTTLHEPEGTVRASRWARLAAWFGGATTRRRQTEQDESEYDDTALPRQVGVAIGLTLGFFLAFMGVAWIVGVL